MLVGDSASTLKNSMKSAADDDETNVTIVECFSWYRGWHWQTVWKQII